MQFIDLKAQYNASKSEIDRAVQTVLEEGQFISGVQVKEFERELAEFVGVDHVVTCANGTDALQLLYMAYDVSGGDAVFCPDITFIATVEPAVMLGATPVFCDVSPDSYNVFPESLRRQINAVVREGKLTPKVVATVDFLGNPADYDALNEICKEYGLILIEDAAQSFGASYKGGMCGSFGGAAITSFFPAKPLGCYGDGGAIMTNSENIADLCRSLCVHGKGSSKYDNIRIGVNSRLDTLQAAILRIKLKALKDSEMEKRQIVARKYDAAFKDICRFKLIKTPDDCVSVYAQYALLAENRNIRDHIITHLTELKIPSMIYYKNPMHRLKVFENINVSYGEKFSVSDDYCSRTFSLPMHPYLNEADQKTVIDAVLEACG